MAKLTSTSVHTAQCLLGRGDAVLVHPLEEGVAEGSGSRDTAGGVKGQHLVHEV